MSNLSQRLQKVQIPFLESQPDLSHLSLQDLMEKKISFGKAHHGKTFEEVWQNEQTWVSWFVNRFANSTKAEHVIFLKFVELKVERAEITGAAVPLTSQKEVEKILHVSQTPTASMSKGPIPKAKAKPMARNQMEATVWDLEEEDPELFEVIHEDMPSENINQIQSLENRMQGVESALASILHHLESMSIATAIPQ